MFQQELKRRQKEKAAADMMEEVREMEKGEGKVQSRERTACGKIHERGGISKPRCC